MFKNWKLILVGILGIHIFLLTQLRFTAWPEMLLWPYMMIHGLLPYKDIAIVHTPYLLVDLALYFKLFGIGVPQLKTFTWFLIVLTDVLIYWVTNKLWKRKVALISTFSYILLQIFFDGNGLWFDLMLVPLSVLMFYLLSQKKYFWSGIIWAVMFLTKQTAFWFLMPIGFSLIQNSGFKIQDFKKFILGTLSMIVLSVFILLVIGILPDFYNWAINFGLFVLPRAQGQIQLPDLRNLLIAGFPFAVLVPFLLNKNTRNFDLLFWVIAGAMGAYPRFEYFHFQPALPFLAIVLGIVIVGIKRKEWMKPFIIFFVLGSVYLFASYFMRNWKEGVRFLEADVSDVTSYVKNNTNENDKIFVMNWWDNIYPLTGTLPGTDPWVPQLSWYQEIPGIQEKEVERLKVSKPKMILLQNYSETGLASYKPQKVYDYVMANYKLKEKIDNIEILILR